MKIKDRAILKILFMPNLELNKDMWGNIIRFTKITVRRFVLKPCGNFFSVFLLIVGGFYTILEVLKSISKSHETWTSYAAFVSKIDNNWLLQIIVSIAIISIAVAIYRREKTIYSLKGRNVVIAFDISKVCKGSGHRVIEISDNFCLDSNIIGLHNELAEFKIDFTGINGSVELSDVINKSIKNLQFKPAQSCRGKHAVYPLGVFGICDFKKRKFIFATSIKRDQNNKNITTDDDFTVFLSEFWKNASQQEWKNDTLRIPVFSAAGKFTQNIQMRMYLILMTFIRSVKNGNVPCRELRICINNEGNETIDLNSFVSLCQYIDDFDTASYSGGKRVGTPLQFPEDNTTSL